MFVFVIDTSFMNVSISAVVEDLDTTVSGVQAAVAIEALVSAAFILIGSKVGDLFGRKRAYVTGMVFYAVGALAMGALAIGALAIARLAVGRMTVRRARFRKVEIDELTVRRLRALDATPPQSRS